MMKQTRPQQTIAPLLIPLTVFVILTMGLLAHAHHRWDSTLRTELIMLDELAQARRFTTLAELHAERVLANDPSAQRQLVLAELDRAFNITRNLLAGRGQLAGFTIDRPLSPGVREAAEHFTQVLQSALTTVRDRLRTPEQIMALDLRALHSRVEEAAARLETTLLQELADRRRIQHQLDALNILLVGTLTLAVYFLLYLGERKRAQVWDDFIASEARLRAFVGSLPGLSALLDRDGRFLAAFGDARHMRADPPEQLIGRRLEDCLPESVAKSCLRALNSSLHSHSRLVHEYALDLQGERRWFEARIVPVAYTEQVTWVAWDVTARHKAEQRLQDLSRVYGFLSQVNQAVVMISSRHALFEQTCAIATGCGGFTQAWIALFEDNGQRLAPTAHARAQGSTSTFPFIGDTNADQPLIDAWLRGEIVYLNNLQTHPEAPPWLNHLAQSGLRGYAGIPLACDGRVIGVLNLTAHSLTTEHTDELRLLQEIGNDLSFALSRFEIAADRATQTTRAALLASALESARDGIMIVDRQQRIVHVNRAFTDLTGLVEAEAQGRPAQELLGRDEDSFRQSLEEAQSALGCWQGEIRIRTPDQPEPRPLFLTISAIRSPARDTGHSVVVMTDLSPLKQAEERINALSFYDPLTDLPNRQLLQTHIEQALQTLETGTTHGSLAVLFIDLDHFKMINDGLGHATGDELLISVSQRLRQRLPRPSLLGRHSGDEFILVLDMIERPEQADAVARHLLDGLNDAFILADGVEVFVRASIGIAFAPVNGHEPNELIRNAQAAMHAAKQAGGDTVRSFSLALTAAASSRLALEWRLRRALHRNGFELRYQPLVSLTDGSVHGAEVLVRMGPDGEDPVGPDVFIPIMEETGLILELGRWVQSNACQQGRIWLDAGYPLQVLAINLSTQEICRCPIAAQVREVLAETGYPASHLELEVTESGLMERGVDARQLLQALKDIGLRLSIDDFGTGYSSLAYLTRFPIDKLKIDRSFIQDIPNDDDSMQLAATIIAMGQNLGLRILAEGVETEAQAAFLRQRGCDDYQGYLCSPPVTAHEFEQRFLLPGRNTERSA